MPDDQYILKDADRDRLVKAVQSMQKNKESEATIQAAVDDFKKRYGVKKKEDGAASAVSPSASSVTKQPAAQSSPSGSDTSPDSENDNLFGGVIFNFGINQKKEDAVKKGEKQDIIPKFSSSDVSSDKGSALSQAEEKLSSQATPEQKQSVHEKISKFRNDFFEGSLTPEDLDLIKGELNGISSHDAATMINNKSRNLRVWANKTLMAGIDSYNSQLNDINKKLETLYGAIAPTPVGAPSNIDQIKSSIKDLENQKAFLHHSLSQVYNAESDMAAKDMIGNLNGIINPTSFYELEGYPGHKMPISELNKQSPLKYNNDTKTLDSDSEAYVRKYVDDYLNKHASPVINYSTSGDLAARERNFPDIANKVIDYFNTVIPVKYAQQDFQKQFISDHPGFKPILDHQRQIENYFSKENADKADAYIKGFVDKQFLNIKQKYFGGAGKLSTNPQFIGIQEKYAQRVASNEMDRDVANSNMASEIGQNASLKSIYESYKKETELTQDKAREMWGNFIIKGLKEIDPKLTFYKDGTVGVEGDRKIDSRKLMQEYTDGLAKATASVLNDQNKALNVRADEKARRMGAFWGNLTESMGEMSGSFRKFWFDKTGWGGDDLRMYQSESHSIKPISESDVAKKWNWSGLNSLLNPNFYLSNVGKQLPLFGGAAAVAYLTDAAGLPDYLSWLGSAGLIDAQNSLQTYNDLATSGVDQYGNKLTEYDAARASSNQFKESILPDMLFMAANSGILSRAKQLKPSIGKEVVTAAKGAAIGTIPMAYQGYLQYANTMQAEGKNPDIWDYAQDPAFGKSLIEGAVGGLILGLAHVPGAYAKKTENWRRLISNSEGEFREHSLFNVALQHEMDGKGNQWRDAIKIKLATENLSPSEKHDLTSALLYSTAVDKNARSAGLDMSSTNGLYQAHNLALADYYDHLAETNKGSNKSLYKIFNDRAKEFKDEAAKAMDGTAKYHYLIDANDQPIFMSDKSLKILDESGKIADWINQGIIKDFHSSDDIKFSEEYKSKNNITAEPPKQVAINQDQAKQIIDQLKLHEADFSGGGKLAIGTHLEDPSKHQDIAEFLVSQAIDHPAMVKEMIGNEAYKAIKPIIDKAKSRAPKPEIQSAVIEVGGRVYEAKNHPEAIEKARAAGEDMSGIDRERDGKFRLSNGDIIDREEAMKRFGADHSEDLLPQNEPEYQKYLEQLKSKQNAEKVRSDQGQMHQGGRIGEELQDKGGENIQRPEKAGTKTSDQEIKVGLTSATMEETVPEIAEKMRQAQSLFQSGDHEGAQKLYNEVLDAGEKDLKKRFEGVKGASITLDRTKGNFFGEEEPTFQATLSIQDPADTKAALSAIADFAENFQQKSVHLSEITNTLPEGESYGVENPDGSINEINLDINFDKPLSDQEFADMSKKIQDLGLAGATLNPDKKGLNLYNLSKFKDYETFAREAAGIAEALQSGGRKPSVVQSVRKLWNYGDKEYGATRGYDELRKGGPENVSGKVLPREEVFNKRVDEAAQKLIDFLKPKTTAGTVKAGFGTEDLIRGAADIIKAANKAGQDIKAAIDKAIDYLKDNWDENNLGKLPEKEIRDHFENIFSSKTPDNGKETKKAGEAPVLENEGGGSGAPPVPPSTRPGNLVPIGSEPKPILKTGGTFISRFVRNFGRLASLEKALGTEQEALQSAYRAASSEGTAKEALVKIAREMQKAFGPKANQIYTDLRKVLVQSNLNGKRQRWNDWSDNMRMASNDDMEKWATNPKYAAFHNLPDLEFVTNAMQSRPEFKGMTSSMKEYVGRNDWNGLRDFMATNFNRAAQLVHQLDWSEGRSYDATRKDPEVQKAKGIYYREFGSKVADAQNELGGSMNQYLGEEGVYYPLAAMTPEEGNIKRKWFEKKNPLAKSGIPYNDFATGMGHAYDLTVKGMQDRITSAYKAKDKNALIGELKTQGYMVRYENGNLDNVIDINDKFVPATKVNINEGTGLPPVYYLIPEGVEKDVRAMINTRQGNLSTEDLKNAIKRVTGFSNKMALSTPIEALRHASNLLFRLNKNTPYAFNNLGGKTIGAVPVIKQIMQLGHLSFMNPTSEKWQSTLREMAAAGEIPDKYGKYTSNQFWADMTGADKLKWWKGQFGQLLYSSNGIDIRARLMMWDIAKGMNPNATPAQMRTVMSALGDYNRGLQAEVVSLLKEQTGWAPFIVSQQARMRSGVESISGIIPKYSSLPLEGLDFGKKMYYHTMNLLQSSVYGYAGMWAASYLAVTGNNPFTTQGARFGIIPYTDEDGNEVDINLGAFYTAANVGTKLSGIDAYYNKLSEEPGGAVEGISDIDLQLSALQKGLLQAMNTSSAPVFSGSPAMHMFMGAFGVAPYVVGVNDDRGYPSINLLPTTIPAPKPGEQLPLNIANDVIHTNPLVGTVVDQTMKHTVGFSLEKEPSRSLWKDAFYQSLLEGLFPGIFVNKVDLKSEDYYQKKSELEQGRGYQKEIKKQSE